MALWILSRTNWVIQEETFTHPLTPVVVINHPLSASSNIVIYGILPVQFTCLTVFLHNLWPNFLWSTSWPGTLHFILHTFLHPIIVFFSQHMPIPSQPVQTPHEFYMYN